MTNLRTIAATTGETERVVRDAFGRVHADLVVGDDDNASIAALAFVDLFARTFGSLSIYGNPSERERLYQHAHAVNPAMDEEVRPAAVRISVVLGSRESAAVRYWGLGWWAGREEAVGAATVPMGPVLAGIMAFNDLFKFGLADLLSVLSPQPAAPGWSLLDFQARSVADVDLLALPKRSSASTALVGCGAIGHAAAFVLGGIDAIGEAIDVVDPQTISWNNLQRYCGTTTRDAERREHKSAAVAESLVQAAFPSARSYVLDWAGYLRAGNAPEIVLCALDNAADRRTIQAALPRLIVNAWTRLAECGAAVHEFSSEGQCLACTYLPRSSAEAQSDVAQLVSELGLPPIRVVQLLGGISLAHEDLRLIERHRSLRAGSLSRWRGESLRPLFGQLCGMAQIRVDRRDEYVVPLPQTSALAGLLLAVQYLKVVAGLPWSVRPIEVSLLQGPGDAWQYPILRKVDHPAPCICKDPVYLDAYLRRWVNTDVHADPR